MFKKGDRVICVDDTLKYKRIIKGFLRKGSIYTIRKSYISQDDNKTEGVYLKDAVKMLLSFLSYNTDFNYYF